MVFSMSWWRNVGDCAVAETLFTTLKGELLGDFEPATRKDAPSAMFEYLEGFHQ